MAAQACCFGISASQYRAIAQRSSLLPWKNLHGAAWRSHCCVGQALQQHNPVAKGNLLWQLDPTALGKLSDDTFGVFFYLLSGVEKTKLSRLKISFVLDSKKKLLTTYGLIPLFLCFVRTYLANWLCCKTELFYNSKKWNDRKYAFVFSLLLSWEKIFFYGFTPASFYYFICQSCQWAVAGPLFLHLWSMKSAAAGGLLSAAECLSLLNVLHQGHPFQTYQFYFHFHFFLPRCLCGLWSSRSQLRHPISASHVSKREKCKLSKHRGKWICQGRTALLSLEMSRDIISTCVSMFVFAEVTSS